MKHLFILLTCAAIVTASSCETDPIIDTTEEEAARILANTPTELPPITTTGQNTMGAWIIPQPGSELALEAGTDSILFVASGVERIDPIGASSTDCNAFQNFRYQSENYISIIGRWCSRPEIGDSREQTLSYTLFDDGKIIIRYSMDLDGGRSVNRFKYNSLSTNPSMNTILLDDHNNRILSTQFETMVFYSDDLLDSLSIISGRLDARYGITP